MEPAPPDLARAAEEWNRGEIYWIVSNGVKMAGMPAFGPTHDAQTIWNIAASMERLPGMSLGEYAACRAAEEGSDMQAHGGSGHRHG